MKWRVLIAITIIISIAFLGAVYWYYQSLTKPEDITGMNQNLLSESAGIAFSTILALSVYYAIDKQRERASQDGLRQLSQEYIADLLHNFVIAVAISFPIENSGKIISCVVPQTRANKDVFAVITILINQIEVLPYIVEGNQDLSDIAAFCYEQEQSNLEQISGLISQYARYMNTWPELVAVIFQFNNTKSKLDRTIAFQERGDIPLYLKKKPDIYLTFLQLLTDVHQLYGEIV